MLSTWAITALVLSTCVFAGELVPISPYPDARVFKGYQYECPSAKVIQNKLYIFGGCYPIPYVVDPAADVDPFLVPINRKTYNVTDNVYSYDMLADEWNLETTTPYPLERAYSIPVNDTVTFSTRNSNLMIREVTKCGPTIPQAKNGNI